MAFTTFLSSTRLASGLTRKPAPASNRFCIVAHSHLSWDNVWQRPQQFLSRLARKYPVLFVETHVVDDLKIPEFTYGPAAGGPGVIQLKVRFPRSTWPDGAYIDRERRRLVMTALLEPRLRLFQRAVQWFYDPMAATAFVDSLNEKLVVYDCMDQLCQFRGAPSEIVQRELMLLKRADLVFCGGSKLHQTKSQFNDNCHFYGCGVDLDHFGQARQSEVAIPEDIASLPRPILGYYGVIDERLDYSLLLRLARNTMGSVVMLGPLAKVSEDDLPKHRNLHWLGRRAYADLPAYAKGFDVCLMPFALNAASEYINPTKALEYLCAGRPVVSTAVPDVKTLFSKVVHIAGDSREFVQLCDDQAAKPNLHMTRRGRRLAASNTWEKIVADLEGHLLKALAQQAQGAEVLESVPPELTTA